MGESRFTAVTGNKKFIVAGGYTKDVGLIPLNFNEDSAIVLMRSDIEPTFTRWVKSYYPRLSASDNTIAGLALNSAATKIFVAVIPSKFSTSEQTFMFLVSANNGACLGPVTTI